MEFNQHNPEIEDIHQLYFDTSEKTVRKQFPTEMEIEINENKFMETEPIQKNPLHFIKMYTDCTEFQKIYDSDEMEFNQHAFQSIIIGRTNVLSIVITENGDVFGSFHTVKIESVTNDLNWTKDDDFFVFSILKNGEDNYQIYKKNEGVYCKERYFRRN